MARERAYIAIDLKSFYASVECVERGLDPLDACLTVADASRTDKTICLAVSPALKAFGVGGRPRLFELVRRVGEVNLSRGRRGKSCSAAELAAHPELAVDFHVAPPRMALYMEYSRRINDIYLQFVAPEDMHVYSVDEVFIDATAYLDMYGVSARELAMRMIRSVLASTGITATAGVGTNMYLCKVAMDIVAKRMAPDRDGVRIAELDENSYRRILWDHEPLTDFWRVGAGTALRLKRMGLRTMGDVARFSLHREEELYRCLGVNAELLVDHAWGWEPVTMDYVKAYEPATHSISSGQVLSRPYGFSEARTVLLEMADVLALELVEKHLATDQVVLYVGYDTTSASSLHPSAACRTDRYGRRVPRHAAGSANLPFPTSSCHILTGRLTELFERLVNPAYAVRRINISANRLRRQKASRPAGVAMQPSLFDDPEQTRRDHELMQKELERERRRQQAVLSIKNKFGKNAILRGFNYREEATQRERNNQIGGHKA